MLENTERLLQINETTYKEVEYLFVIFKAFEIGKVRVEALLYKNEEKFLKDEAESVVFLGDIDFNINQEGLLAVGEEMAIKRFPTLIKCNSLKSVVPQAVEPVGIEEENANRASLLSKMVGFLGFGNGTR